MGMEVNPVNQGEQSAPSGEQDATLPGSTPETSTQMPKEGETTSAGGKSPLKFDPNAPAVDTVARRDQMQVEGELSDVPQERQIHSSAIPIERDPEKAWQEYAVMAINGLYPRLRNGVDYAVGRRTLEGDVELLETAPDVKIDWGKVEEGARKLARQNPYLPGGYTPRQPLHAGSVDEQATSDTLAQRPETAGMSPTAGQPTDPTLREPYEEGQEEPREEEPA